MAKLKHVRHEEVGRRRGGEVEWRNREGGTEVELTDLQQSASDELEWGMP